jgi:hypothetical protein
LLPDEGRDAAPGVAIGRMPTSTTAFTSSSREILKPAKSLISSGAPSIVYLDLMVEATSFALTISSLIFATSNLEGAGRVGAAAHRDKS